MAMLGIGDYLCEACRFFDSDGMDGNHPRCSKQPIWAEQHKGVPLGQRCPYGYEYGVPCGYPVSMKRNKMRAHEIMGKLGIEV